MTAMYNMKNVKAAAITGSKWKDYIDPDGLPEDPKNRGKNITMDLLKNAGPDDERFWAVFNHAIDTYGSDAAGSFRFKNQVLADTVPHVSPEPAQVSAKSAKSKGKQKAAEPSGPASNPDIPRRKRRSAPRQQDPEEATAGLSSESEDSDAWAGAGGKEVLAAQNVIESDEDEEDFTAAMLLAGGSRVSQSSRGRPSRSSAKGVNYREDPLHEHDADSPTYSNGGHDSTAAHQFERADTPAPDYDLDMDMGAGFGTDDDNGRDASATNMDVDKDTDAGNDMDVDSGLDRDEEDGMDTGGDTETEGAEQQPRRVPNGFMANTERYNVGAFKVPRATAPPIKGPAWPGQDVERARRTQEIYFNQMRSSYAEVSVALNLKTRAFTDLRQIQWSCEFREVSNLLLVDDLDSRLGYAGAFSKSSALAMVAAIEQCGRYRARLPQPDTDSRFVLDDDALVPPDLAPGLAKETIAFLNFASHLTLPVRSLYTYATARSFTNAATFATYFTVRRVYHAELHRMVSPSEKPLFPDALALFRLASCVVLSQHSLPRNLEHPVLKGYGPLSSHYVLEHLQRLCMIVWVEQALAQCCLTKSRRHGVHEPLWRTLRKASIEVGRWLRDGLLAGIPEPVSPELLRPLRSESVTDML